MSWISKRSGNGLYEYEHKNNGLRLLLMPQEGLPVATLNVTYHVGSREEGLGLHGDTHALEHLMFKGSKNFHGDKGMWYLENLGAVLNATTYLDRTNYFEVIETDNLLEAIKREADRMLQPLLRQEDLDKEMKVIRNEYERGENSAYQNLHKRLFNAAFVAHPYGKSTIGFKSDIENLNAEKLRAFHNKYYMPNNATVTIVGNFNPEKMMKYVDEHFGKIEKGPEIDTMYTVEPQQEGMRRVSIKRETRSSILGLGFKAPHGLHRDAIALEVVANLISQGTDALSTPLKQDGIIHDCMASWERMKDPYLFCLYATTNYPTKDALDAAEKAIRKMVKSFPRPSEEKLNVVKKAIDFKWRAEMEGTQKTAMCINEAISRGDPFDMFNRFTVLENLKPDDIIRVAKKYFDEDKMTVATYLPGVVKKSSYSRLDYKTPEYAVAPEHIKSPNMDTLNFVRSSTEGNGITFTKYNNTSNTHIMVSLQSPDNSYTAKEYVTRMVLSKMMMKGAYVNSSTCNEAAIGKFLKQNGIQRHFSHSPNGINLSLTIPNGDGKVVNKMVKLMKAECESPLLERQDFVFTRNRLIAELNGSMDDVNTAATTKLYQNLFKQGDANYRHSVNELVQALRSISISDVKQEHDKLVKAAYTKLTILGNDLIRTCSMKTSSNALKFERSLNHAAQHMQRIDIPAKTSCTVAMGMVVKPSIDLVVACGVLGNGFSGRLMKWVRDTKGLTYGIGSKVKRENGTAVLRIVATFAPSVLDEGMRETNTVLDKWFTADVTQQEVDTQKQILLGSRLVHFDNPSSIIATLHNASVNGHGVKYLDDFSAKVKSVTLRSVRAAIQALDKNNLKTVIAGTFTS